MSKALAALMEKRPLGSAVKLTENRISWIHTSLIGINLIHIVLVNSPAYMKRNIIYMENETMPYA